jgi:hypothetical protein
MRVYVHFEEEEPNYTVALTVGGPETTLEDLLANFLQSYLEYYGEGAADLEADCVELRNSKLAPYPLLSPIPLLSCASSVAQWVVLDCALNFVFSWSLTRTSVGCPALTQSPSHCVRGCHRQKKLKRGSAVSSQVNERDDIFIVRGSGAVPKQKKSRRKQVQLNLPAVQSPSTHQALRPAPAARQTTPQPGPAHDPTPAEVSSDDDSAEAERMQAMQEQMRALAIAKEMNEAAASAGVSGSSSGSTKAANRFIHQFDRQILGGSDGQDIVDSSPMPTHEHNVQANCLKCRVHIFYSAQTALATCHACKLVHSCVECRQCGTFFPAPAQVPPADCTLPETLNPKPSTLNPQPSTLNPQPSTLNLFSTPLPAIAHCAWHFPNP